jgi:RNAse (barnase) inhibitor barstar
VNPVTNRFEQLLRDVARAGVYHLPDGGGSRDEILSAAENCGYVVFPVDLSRVKDKQELLQALGRAMAFPEWYGSNWDALADCLDDLGWRPGEGYLVLLEHGDLLHERAAGDLVAALQIFTEAANSWRERGIALWCLVDMQADGIAWLQGL